MEDYLKICDRLLRSAREYAYEEYCEILGIANVTNCDIRKIIFALGYTDLWDYFANSKNVSHKNQECSCLLFKNKDNIFLAQNWDMDKGTEDYICIIEKNYNDGIIILSVTSVLGLTHVGLNNCGVAIGTANLASYSTGDGLLFPFIIQKLLRQHMGFDDIIAIRDIPRFSSHYYQIITSDNLILGVECDAHSCCFIEDERCVLHTNHYINFFENGVSYSATSLYRYNKMKKYADKNNNLTINKIRTIFTRKQYGIIRYEDDIVTVATIIISPQNGTLYIKSKFRYCKINIKGGSNENIFCTSCIE